LHILDTHRQPDALIIGEPSGWRTVVLGYKGKLDFRYRVSVESTHPTNPLPKAGELAAGCWQEVLDLLGPQASHARFEQPGATMVSISGDLTSASTEVSIRTPPAFDAAGFLTALRARLLSGELEFINFVAACRVDRTDPVVRALSAAIRQAGSAAGAKVKTATSDMNTLAEHWQIPMATYGPGESVLDHADDEHVLLADYLASIRVLSTALNELSTTLAPVPAGIGDPR
jgi:LysW-gamma-L-lysine carboxypeptidase